MCCSLLATLCDGIYGSNNNSSSKSPDCAALILLVKLYVVISQD